MKKKIAILLAAIMTISPLTVFGASDNYLTKQLASLTEKTLIFEEGGLVNKSINLFPEDDAESDEKIEYATDGTTLKIKVKDTAEKGSLFKVTLENSRWFFRSNRSDAVLTTTSDASIAIAKLLAENTVLEAPNADNISPEGKFVGLVDNDTLTFGNVIQGKGISYELRSDLLKIIPSITIVTADIFNGKTPSEVSDEIVKGTIKITDNYTLVAGDLKYPKAESDFSSMGATILKENGTVTSVGFAGEANSKEISTYDTNKGMYFPYSNTYIRFEGQDVAYSLSLTGTSNEKDYSASVRLNKSYAAPELMPRVNATSDTISIPLVSLTEGEGDIRVRVANESNFSVVTTESLQYGIASTTATDTTITEKVIAKYSFPLNRIEIKEKVPGSIRAGQIVLKAPYGYYFADPLTKSKPEEGKTAHYPIVKAFEDLYFKDNRTVMENNTAADGVFITYGAETSTSANGTVTTKVNKDVLVINTKNQAVDATTKLSGTGINHSGRTNGKLAIEGLVLIAQDFAPVDDKILINITGTGITEQDFEIGTRKDWGVDFKTTSDPTKLINGRYTDALAGSEFDKDHKTAKVKFSENVIASWWALRESEFTLPEGVKFRKVKISKEENFDHINTTFALNGTYEPRTERDRYVQLTANKLRITDLEIKRDKTASFEMEVWVSVEPGWEGDILLSAGGNDILKETTPLKVAYAISPITVKTEVKDVKIGYQWQKIADFVITETEPGALKRDTEVDIFIDDNITGNDRIAFAPDFITEVNTDSKILFSKPAVSGGVISFNIERQSYGKPASIKFSNIYIKVDRTVPESNKRPYNIVIGGNAIAANYKARPTSIDPMFTVKGIGTGFFNVVTSANDKDSILSNVVRVTIGSNEVLVGRESTTNTITMDTAAYISAESNSTMVPVRFVSQAFGIPDNQVLWDNEARTVTIYNGARIIQFKIGSSEITVNGVTTTMYSPDATPLKVKAEVKDNRSFLPFRALGYALGVEVNWDAETQTAIYNAHLLESSMDEETITESSTTSNQ